MFFFNLDPLVQIYRQSHEKNLIGLLRGESDWEKNLIGLLRGECYARILSYLLLKQSNTIISAISTMLQ